MCADPCDLAGWRRTGSTGTWSLPFLQLVELGKGSAPSVAVDNQDAVHVSWYETSTGTLKYSLGY